jgi:response regulator of citrate/malate metabolism
VQAVGIQRPVDVRSELESRIDHLGGKERIRLSRAEMTRLSLDDLIESLGEAKRKQEKPQGLDAKTFQAVLRDRSKKPSA